MTEKQTRFYTRRWIDYSKILRARGYSNADIVAERSALYVRALGSRISSKKWTTAQFNEVLTEMDRLLKPDDLNAAMETPEQRLRKSHYRSIMALGFPPEYIAGMLRRFAGNPDADDLDELTVEQLRKFNIVCQKAARAGYAKPRK